MQYGQLENAAELCKRGLVYFPDNISGYAVLAQVYTLLGRADRALNVLEQGYHRTGAEGLQTLRKIVNGEIPPFVDAGEPNGQAASDEAVVEKAPDEPAPQEAVEDAQASVPQAIESAEIEEGKKEGKEEDLLVSFTPTETIGVEEEKAETASDQAPESEVASDNLTDIAEPPVAEVETGIEEEREEEQEEATDDVPAQTAEPAAEAVEETEIEEEKEELPEPAVAVAENSVEKVEATETDEATGEPEQTAEPTAEAVEETEIEEEKEIEEPAIAVVENPVEEVEATGTDEATDVPAQTVEPTVEAVEETEIEEEKETEEPAVAEDEVEEEKPEQEEKIADEPQSPAFSSSPLRTLPAFETGEEEPDAGGLRFRTGISSPSDKREKPEGREAGTHARSKPGSDNRTGRGVLSLHSGTKISRLSSSNLRLIPGLEFAPLRRDDDLKIRIAPLVNEPPPAFDLSFDPIIPGLPTAAEPGIGSTDEPAAKEAAPQDDRAVETDGPLDEGLDLFAEEPTFRVEAREREDFSIPEPGPQPDEAHHIAPESETSVPEEERPTDLFPTISGRSFEEDFDLFLPDPEPEEPIPAAPSRPESNYSGMTPLEELARRLETARIPIVEEEQESYDSPAFEPSIVSDTFAAILVGQGAYSEAVKAYQMLARLKPERRQEYEKKIADLRKKMSG